jgi:TDG/mug DNA glycosylase family protein
MCSLETSQSCSVALQQDRSAERRAYYAGEAWQSVLADACDCWLKPQELAPAECARFLDYGIGLTDLTKNQSGSDRDLRIDRADVMLLRSRIVMYQPQYLCFNGKRAAQVFLAQSLIDYGVQGSESVERFCTWLRRPVVPRRGAWDITVWQDLASRVLRNRHLTALRLMAAAWRLSQFGNPSSGRRR